MSNISNFSRFCIDGLENMYIPNEGIFSSSYRLRRGSMVNIRDWSSEYRYTMNCLAGLYKVKKQGIDVFLDIESDYYRLVARGNEQSSNVENIAATIWTGHCIGARIPNEILRLFNEIFEKIDRIERLTAQGLAWMIIACAERGEEYQKKVLRLTNLASERYIHPKTHLVRHESYGFRRDWASFAASCYMSYAFLRVARKTGDELSKSIGIDIARAIVQLQGPQGQWAWFYHVPSGKVADYYPVYSVHQHAMAPIFLLEAIDQGFIEFREPLLKGFQWVLGNNEFGQSMVDGSRHVIWRSLVRQGSFGKLGRYIRALCAKNYWYKTGIEKREVLQVNKECRSYELGWALFAFAGRSDFGEILNDPIFC